MFGQFMTYILLTFVSLGMMLLITLNNHSHLEALPLSQTNTNNLKTSIADCNKEITDLAVSPDASLFATADGVTAFVDLWNRETYSLIKTIPISGEHVTDITFSSDNRLLVWASSTGGIDIPFGHGSIELYDLKTNTVSASLNDVADVVTELNVFDNDTTVSFIGSQYGYLRANVQVWDVVSQKNLAKRDAVDIAPAFSSHTFTSFLATTLSVADYYSYQIEQWDGQNNKILQSIEFVNPISTLALNHDDSMLASADVYGNISIWDTSTFTRIFDFQSGASSIRYLAFIGNDQMMSVEDDGNQQNILIWDIGSQPKIFTQRSFAQDVIGKLALDPTQQVLMLANAKDAPFGISLWDYKDDTLQDIELAC